ncbi:MAG: type II secretion system major pseudopilin GspG [Planctomycetota bacterium]|jgi:general secretion pathway protein G
MKRNYLFCGFTLVELMVVIVIIGLLATVVVVRHMKATEGTPEVRVRVDFRSLEDAIDMYKMHTGQYPEELADLLEQPADAPGWNGPYIKGAYVPRDPWGTEYAYDCIEVTGSDYLLKSAGPNRQFDDEDDLSNIDPPDRRMNG